MTTPHTVTSRVTIRPFVTRNHAAACMATPPTTRGTSGGRASTVAIARVSSYIPYATARLTRTTKLCRYSSRLAMISAPSASPTPIAAGRLRPARDGFAGVGLGAVGFGVSVGAVAGSAAGAQSGSVMRKPAAARSSVDARLSRSKLWRPAPGPSRPRTKPTSESRSSSASIRRCRPGPLGSLKSALVARPEDTSAPCSAPPPLPAHSNLEKLGFLSLDDFVHLRRVSPRDLVQCGLRVPAHRADGHLAILPLVAGDFDQFAPTLLGQLRENYADERSVVARIDAEVGVTDDPLDRAELGGVVGLDDRHSRLGDVHGRQLRDRSGRAVVVDDHPGEAVRARPSRAEAAELVAGDVHRFLHLLLGLEERLVDHVRLSRQPVALTSV